MRLCCVFHRPGRRAKPRACVWLVSGQMMGFLFNVVRPIYILNFVSGAIRDPLFCTKYFNFVNYICKKCCYAPNRSYALPEHNNVLVLNLKKKKSMRKEIIPLNTNNRYYELSFWHKTEAQLLKELSGKAERMGKWKRKQKPQKHGKQHKDDECGTLRSGKDCLVLEDSYWGVSY